MTALGNECPKDEKISHSIYACAFIFLSNNSVLTAACCRAGVEKFFYKELLFQAWQATRSQVQYLNPAFEDRSSHTQQVSGGDCPTKLSSWTLKLECGVVLNSYEILFFWFY